jgi:uracil phosphoribosyltransferase
MLATGGSLILCIEKLKEAGVSEDKITFINLVSCEMGLRNLHARFP